MKILLNTVAAAFISVLALVCWSCEEEYDMFRRFIIKKGEHYATPRVVESLQSNKLIFETRFDESAVYDHGSDALQTNKNKLLGFSDCNSLHHENSARFAWQWYNNRLEIWAYCYVDGTRKEEFIGVAQLNKIHRYEIEFTHNSYKFTFDDQESVVIERNSNCSTGMYYKLWPYFGGSLAAPHDITIAIRTHY